MLKPETVDDTVRDRWVMSCRCESGVECRLPGRLQEKENRVFIRGANPWSREFFL